MLSGNRLHMSFGGSWNEIVLIWYQFLFLWPLGHKGNYSVTLGYFQYFSNLRCFRDLKIFTQEVLFLSSGVYYSGEAEVIPSHAMQVRCLNIIVVVLLLRLTNKFPYPLNSRILFYCIVEWSLNHKRLSYKSVKRITFISRGKTSVDTAV